MKKLSLLFLACTLYVCIAAQVATIGKPLPPWQKGYLDLHHINTGRGNSSFYIFPDGTTMLVDAGEQSPVDPQTFSPRNTMMRPNYSKMPYEWIVNYIKQVAPAKDKTVIDYALITHFHADHFGTWYPGAPLSASGKFALTGMTGVGELLPIHLLIDRGYPNYNYPTDMKKLAGQNGMAVTDPGRTIKNYFDFIADKQKQGMNVAQLKAGSSKQIRLVHDEGSFPSFYVQNVKSNQWIWTGKDSSAVQQFSTPDSSNGRLFPDENVLSLALTIHYGPFTYYTGGDNPGNVFFDDNPLRDVETPMARAIGEVDIAILDHHGNRDAVNEFMVKTFKPRVWIGLSWSANHPGNEVLLRMTSTYLYPGPRDLFCTNMLEANKIVIGPLIDRAYKSQQGHIVVRVMPGGKEYYVIILDDSRADIPVKDIFGPYQSK